MPTYEYLCEDNGRVVAVWHSVKERLQTWGELCARAGERCGDTPADAGVTRLVSGGCLIGAAAGGDGESAPAAGHKHGHGCGCGF